MKLPIPLERDIQRAILQALIWVRDFECWRNNTGAFKDAHGQMVFFGLAKGSADIVGVLKIHLSVETPQGPRPLSLGRFVALEVKRPGEKPTADQVLWQAKVRDMGGFAAVVTTVEEALDAVERARRGDLR
jgi:hypothetical protein